MPSVRFDRFYRYDELTAILGEGARGVLVTDRRVDALWPVTSALARVCARVP